AAYGDPAGRWPRCVAVFPHDAPRQGPRVGGGGIATGLAGRPPRGGFVRFTDGSGIAPLAAEAHLRQRRIGRNGEDPERTLPAPGQPVPVAGGVAAGGPGGRRRLPP